MQVNDNIVDPGHKQGLKFYLLDLCLGRLQSAFSIQLLECANALKVLVRQMSRGRGSFGCWTLFLAQVGQNSS